MSTLLNNLNSGKLSLNSVDLNLVLQLGSDLLIGEMELDFLLQQSNQFLPIDVLDLILLFLALLGSTLVFIFNLLILFISET
jgi:hypothetical protein